MFSSETGAEKVIKHSLGNKIIQLGYNGEMGKQSFSTCKGKSIWFAETMTIYQYISHVT